MSSVRCIVSGCVYPRHYGKQYCLEHFKSQGDVVYGLDAELKQKKEGKYDVQKEREVRAWIEAVVGIRFPSSDFHASMKSGVILCQLANKIRPGIVGSISNSQMPFPQRENITAFVNAMKQLGVRESNVFVSQDLFEGDNIPLVIDSLYAFAGVCQKVPGFRGPYLGLKPTETNVREFSEAQLLQARAAESRQNAGAIGWADNTPRTVLDTNVRVPISNPAPPKATPLPPSNPSSAPVAAKRFCGQCGTKSTGGKFCHECGQPL